MTTTKIHKIPSFIPIRLAVPWLEFLRETRQSIEIITNVCKGKKTVMVFNDADWELLSETLDLDACSGNFDVELRKDILRALDRDRSAMLDYAQKNPRDYAMLMFAADTGCREAGIAGLQLKDLDIDRGRAIVFEKGRGGNGKGRTVYFLGDTATALRKWMYVRPKDCDFVFSSTRGGELTVTGVYEVFKRIAIATRVHGKWSPHQWRHWRARKWAERGMNLGIVAQLLGHTDVKVTSEYYGTFADADLQKAHQKYSLGDIL